MSGLEALGAIVAIGDVLQKSKKCYDQFRRLQRSPQEVRDLISELSRCQAMFAEAKRQLEVVVSSSNGHTSSTTIEWVAAVAELGSRADAKTVELHNLVERNTRQKANALAVKRLRWFLGLEEIAQIKLELANIRDEFSIALGVASSWHHENTRQKLDQIVSVAENLAQEGRTQSIALLAQQNAIKVVCQALEDGQAKQRRLEDLVTGLANMKLANESTASTEQAIVTDSEEDIDLPPPYSTITQELAKLAPRRKSSDTPLPIMMPQPRPTAIRTKQQCQMSCRCVCHRSRRLTSPRFLRSWTGSWSITVSGWNSVAAACDIPGSCKRAQTANTHLTYVLPNWLMSRAVDCFTQSGYLGDPGMQLKIRRIIKTDAFRLAQTGDVDGLHALYTQGLASVHDVNPQEGQSALLTAVWCGQAEVVRYLLRSNARMDEQTFDGLETSDAVLRHVYGKVSSPKTNGLLAHLFNLEDLKDEQQFTVLHKIVLGLADSRNLEEECSEHPELVNVTDLRGRSPLWWAALRRDLRSCEILLKLGANPNNADYQGESVMQNAAGTTCTDIVRLLLDNGVGIGPGAGVSETPLHYAARSDSRLSTVRLLLEEGSDANAANQNGITPFHECIEADAIDVATLLVKHKADLTLRDHSGDHYFHMAIVCRASRVLRLLVLQECDFSLLGGHRQTVLHSAAQFGDGDIAEVLTGASLLGVDADAIDAHGKTASTYAKERAAEYSPYDPEYASTIIKTLLTLIESVKISNNVAEELHEI